MLFYPPNSYRTTCPQCNCDIKTETNSSPNLRTHLVAMLLCLIFCCPCAFIPYCFEDCQDVHHYCPVCEAYIGVHPGLL